MSVFEIFGVKRMEAKSDIKLQRRMYGNKVVFDYALLMTSIKIAALGFQSFNVLFQPDFLQLPFHFTSQFFQPNRFPLFTHVFEHFNLLKVVFKTKKC